MKPCDKFGQLTVLEIMPKKANARGNPKVKCECACGKTVIKFHSAIVRMKSCGCLNNNKPKGKVSESEERSINKVLNYLHNHTDIERLTVSETMERLGLSKHAATFALGRLNDYGKIEKHTDSNGRVFYSKVNEHIRECFDKLIYGGYWMMNNVPRGL